MNRCWGLWFGIATQLAQKALFARGARLNCRGRSLIGVALQVALCVQDQCTKRVGVAIPLGFGSWLLSFDAEERFRELGNIIVARRHYAASSMSKNLPIPTA